MKFISIGKVVGEYGLDGLIKIKPNTSYPELFFEMEYLLLTENNQVVLKTITVLLLQNFLA